MTLDDLQKIYHAAWRDDEGHNPQRAGVTAIVRALRDEIWTRIGCVEANDIINEILGSEAGEKVAEGNFTNPSEGRVIAPATDPTVGQRLIKAANEAAAIARGEVTDAAPAVCVWTMDMHPDDGSHYDTACGDAWCSVLGGTPKQDNYSFCPSCGKPITFTEAK